MNALSRALLLHQLVAEIGGTSVVNWLAVIRGGTFREAKPPVTVRCTIINLCFRLKSRKKTFYCRGDKASGAMLVLNYNRRGAYEGWPPVGTKYVLEIILNKKRAVKQERRPCNCTTEFAWFHQKYYSLKLFDWRLLYRMYRMYHSEA